MKQTVLLSIIWCAGVEACIFLASVLSPGYHVLYWEANIDLYSHSFATSTHWYVKYIMPGGQISCNNYATAYAIFITVTLTSSADSVCPGDTVVFTCVTDTAPLIWSTSVNEHVKVYYPSDQVNQPAVNFGGIFIKLVNTTGQFVSTATAYNVSSDYNRVNITCSNSLNCLSCSGETKSITVGKKSPIQTTLQNFVLHVHTYIVKHMVFVDIDF